MVLDKALKTQQTIAPTLIAALKSNRTNRVYYKKPSEAKTFFDSGSIQSAEKSKYDWFSLDKSRNDSIYMYGIDPDGSHFELDLSVVSIFDDILRPDKESKWRLGKINFLYHDIKSKSKYSYKHEELIDYESRRANVIDDKHTNLNTIKIGSLTLEVVLPFGYNRILFQGLFIKEYENGLHQLVPGRLAISSHPTSDKFDYTYRFNKAYTTNAVVKSLDPCRKLTSKAGYLIQTMLEDRIDQPLMFHAHFDIPSLEKEKSLMWGSKVKKIINLKDENEAFIMRNCGPSESLFLWSECGHLIHLNRPIKLPHLVNGMIHNTFEYASHIYSANWDTVGEEATFEKDMGQLGSFDKLSAGIKIKLIGFKAKDNIIEFLNEEKRGNTKVAGLSRIKINGFHGWALYRRHHVGSILEEAQQSLLALNLNDRKFCSTLASDHLLGGKGFSLVELNNMVRMVEKKVPNVVVCGESNRINNCIEVNVPRAIILTSLSFKLWLGSDPKISKALENLDATRRILSARSYYVNPYSEKHLTMKEQQRVLSESCKKCVTILESCPLPEIIRLKLRSHLVEIFGGENDFAGKLFAIRSSALGEDSLETSAAGQMKTILNAKGLDMICQSIVSCWASQFELPAVTYKTQNGLSFQWPMAVIVQELIECHSAGVGATCEPLMGNPRQLEITACLGLGEGVVSGRATDTIRLDLKELAWDFPSETVGAPLSLDNIEQCIELEPSDGQRAKRYLTNQFLVSLGNLLLWIRGSRQSTSVNGHQYVKDREVEWGMTWHANNNNLQYVTNPSPMTRTEQLVFKLHLFQSRPLTNLQRLSSREIDFELDNGLSGPMELISRANIGEVMPGTQSPLSMCILTLQAAYAFKNEVNDKNYSIKFNANPAFSYAGRIVAMNVTEPSLVQKLGGGSMSKADRQSFALSIGMEPEMVDEIMKLIKEKYNPNYVQAGFSKSHLYLSDMGILDVKLKQLRKQFNQFSQNLKQLCPINIDQWISKIQEGVIDANELEQQQSNDDTKSTTSSKTTTTTNGFTSDSIGKMNNLAKISSLIVQDVEKLFKFLTNYDNPFFSMWFCFHEASQCSVHFNRLCIEHMSKQPYYMNPENVDKVLIDFSVLIQGTTKTESGDISNLLEKLVDCLKERDLMHKVVDMSPVELYKLLTNNVNEQEISQEGSLSRLFQKFLDDNGHRGWKEYDVDANTWIDDPSQIIRSLKGRVKQRLARDEKIMETSHINKEQVSSSDDFDHISLNSQDVVYSREKRVEEILANIESNKIWFKNYLLSGARRGIVRRELGKSNWVFTVHLLRQAYRHMAALLCLLGFLPNIELLPFFNIEELDHFVSGPWMLNPEIANRADIARLLFKARRRQQRTRVLERVSPPKPTMKLQEFYDLIYQMTEDKGQQLDIQQLPAEPSTSSKDSAKLIRGLTSCAGLVTGRACVIKSLDEVDEIQEGDILITYSIDVSWTVYFYALGGIVTELGGLVSHGAVVAREYGIPTLCTAMGACSKFKTGQIVTLDANNSCCYLTSEC